MRTLCSPTEDDTIDPFASIAPPSESTPAVPGGGGGVNLFDAGPFGDGAVGGGPVMAGINT